MFLKIKNTIDSNFDKDKSSLILSLLLGYKDEMNEEMKTNFSESNMMHILAVSGMHIGIIIFLIKIFLEKNIGKRNNKIFTSIVIIIYMFISGFSPSIVRAGMMALIMIISFLLNRKNDIWQSICFSLLVLLIYNPFLAKSVGVIFSFLGTIGMIVKPKNIKKGISISIYISFFMIPILAVFLNKIPILSIFISFIATLFILPIILMSFLFILFHKILGCVLLKSIIVFICNLIIKISELGKNLPLNNIYVPTPSIFFIALYYIFLFIIFYLRKIYSLKSLNNSQKRIKNLISLFKYRLIQNKIKTFSMILILFISFIIIKHIPNNLKIYFIDVGQGDSCLIITPYKKSILIDGGGTDGDLYDVGKNTLLPYLLDRQITSLDYIFISHFDSDHVKGILSIIKELKVRRIIISKQVEESENYKIFKNIVKYKKIKVVEVNKGDRIIIEDNIHVDVLWPNNRKMIQENKLNNNSLVCKFCYKDFSCLFTGDIEEKAERQILEEYKNKLQVLKSTMLKVAHHGSKTSSIQEFLDAVNPKIVLIGVGEKNIFGHPNIEVIKRLESMRNRNI